MNKQVSQLLDEIADLLEVQGDRFRPRAYRRAARQIETLSEDIQEAYERGDIEKIPWIGSGIGKKITEFLSTGQLEYLNELRREVDPGLSGIMEIEGKLLIYNIDMGKIKARLAGFEPAAFGSGDRRSIP